MSPTSQLAVLSAATTGAGLLMMLSGVHTSLLAWRHQTRRCPCSGRLVRGRVCELCDHRAVVGESPRLSRGRRVELDRYDKRIGGESQRVFAHAPECVFGFLLRFEQPDRLVVPATREPVEVHSLRLTNVR
jgi:hypothetical protein